MTAVLEVLDITIVNVALPAYARRVRRDLGPDHLGAHLVSRVCRRGNATYRLSLDLARAEAALLGAITGFVVSSALCGMAWNLETMVLFRLAQGIFGAPLVPLSQAILLDVFPRERHGQALAIFGLGIMVAPCSGRCSAAG
jgi:DHA2 family multidrug resistance protein